MTVKFSKGKILIDSIFSNSGAFNAQLKNKDQIIGIDNNKLNEVYYYSDFYNLSLGNENSISNLTIIREKDTINIDVKRLKIPNHSIIPIPNSLNANSINSYKEGLKLFDLIYPDTITNSEITEYGIRFMLEQLDPHSTYISLKDLHDMNAPLKGSFTGVGIRFQIFKDTVLVVQAIPGGPSEKVGLMAGDKIIKIGEEMVAGIGMKNSGVRDRLLGDKGTKVSVGVKRGNSNEIIDFEITRDKIPIYSVDASYMANENTGYIKLNNFSSTSISEIRKAVFSLKIRA